MSDRPRTCGECGRRRERCRATTRHADGSVEWCCPGCWRDLGMVEFFHEPGCACEHCRRSADLLRGL